jgi:hypothetical protein
MFELKAIKYALAASLAAGAFCFASTAANVTSTPEPATVAEPAPAGPATATPFTAPRYFNPYTRDEDNPTDSPGTWEVYPSPTNKHLNRIDFVDANDGWAVGDGVILHYEGGNWTISYENGRYHFLDVDMVSRNEGWAVSNDFSEERYWIWRWNGERWMIFHETEDDVFCIDMPDANYGWAGGSAGLYFFNGSEWTRYWPWNKAVREIQIMSRGTGRAVWMSYIYRLIGDTWFEEDRFLGAVLHGLFMLSNSNGWAFGYTSGEPSKQHGLLLKYDGSWRHYGTFEEAHSILDMDFCGNNYGWTVGCRGGPYPHGSFLAFYNGDEWTEVEAAGGYGLGGVEVLDKETAWAVGLYGTILKYKPNGHSVVIPTSLGIIKSLFK